MLGSDLMYLDLMSMFTNIRGKIMPGGTLSRYLKKQLEKEKTVTELFSELEDSMPLAVYIGKKAQSELLEVKLKMFALQTKLSAIEFSLDKIKKHLGIL